MSRAVTQVVAVVGPTGAGKSALALDLALELGGEIINADSMQLYRGMDIGTAKVPIAERRGIRHHLLDVWDVTHTADVAAYQRHARAVVDELVGRGVVAVLVGGSGLYIRAALDALDFPGTDPALRARLEAELAEVVPNRLHARLAQRDPESCGLWRSSSSPVGSGPSCPDTVPSMTPFCSASIAKTSTTESRPV